MRPQRRRAVAEDVAIGAAERAADQLAAAAGTPSDLLDRHAFVRQILDSLIVRLFWTAGLGVLLHIGTISGVPLVRVEAGSAGIRRDSPAIA
jgi:hypothetical protein